MSLVPKLLPKIGSDLGSHLTILPTQIAPTGAIWVGSNLGTYTATVHSQVHIYLKYYNNNLTGDLISMI